MPLCHAKRAAAIDQHSVVPNRLATSSGGGPKGFLKVLTLRYDLVVLNVGHLGLIVSEGENKTGSVARLARILVMSGTTKRCKVSAG